MGLLFKVSAIWHLHLRQPSSRTKGCNHVNIWFRQKRIIVKSFVRESTGLFKKNERKNKWILMGKKYCWEGKNLAKKQLTDWPRGGRGEHIYIYIYICIFLHTCMHPYTVPTYIRTYIHTYKHTCFGKTDIPVTCLHHVYGFWIIQSNKYSKLEVEQAEPELLERLWICVQVAELPGHHHLVTQSPSTTKCMPRNPWYFWFSEIETIFSSTFNMKLGNSSLN